MVDVVPLGLLLALLPPQTPGSKLPLYAVAVVVFAALLGVFSACVVNVQSIVGSLVLAYGLDVNW